MPKNILIDLNVIVDVFLQRQGFDFSRDVLQLGEQDRCRLYISAHIVTTFAYLLEDAKVPRPKILAHIDWLLKKFRVVSTDAALLDAALKSRIKDFEDAVIEQAALLVQAKVIITNNVEDFKNSTVVAQSPREYLLKTY